MADKSKRGVTVVLGTLLSILISALLCTVVWYQINLYYPSSDFFGKQGSFIDGIIGLALGAVGGAAIGLAVTVPRLGWSFSILAGFLINGAVPLFLFYGTGDSNVADNVRRSWNYSSIGQAVVGAVVGLLISILSSHLDRSQPDDIA